MYNSIRSAKLTKIATILLSVFLAACMVGIIPLLRWYLGAVVFPKMWALIICFYICCPAAWLAIALVIDLVNHILKDEVFTKRTVKDIRYLSWCCLFVAVVCVVGGWFSPYLFVFCVGSAFMTAILHVLKNVFERAVEIKEENDLTV